MRIAHISDLHLPGKNFVREWGERLLEELASRRPELVVITGDMTDDGYLHEYEVAHEFIERIEAEKVIVPGNHDARNKGYEIFEEMFGTRYPLYRNDMVTVLGMDSSEPDIDDGHIGREVYGMLEERLPEDTIKVVALHHHVIPIPGTGRERNILIDAGDFLKLCIDRRIHFVLSGHKHLPWMWKLENTHFITAGTACSRRLKGRSYPSFNLLSITESTISVREINVTSGAEREILRERISVRK